MTELNPETPEEAAAIRLQASSWVPIDLKPYVQGEVEPVYPVVGCARSDGTRFLYPGKEHVVFGAYESGKSWFCLLCVQAELAIGNPVVYVHFEEGSPQGTVERLMDLGVPGDVLTEWFTYVGPAEPAPLGAVDALVELQPTLVILDGVNEALSVHGWDGLGVDGPSALKRRLITPFLAVGAAVLQADHVVKDKEKRGGTPYGGVHKGNKVDGSMILLENREPFGRRRAGRSSVHVTKDRPGYLRNLGVPTKTPGVTYMGELIIDHQEPFKPAVKASFTAPKETDVIDTPASAAWQQDNATVEKVMRSIIKRGLACNVRTIRAEAHIGKDRVSDAIERLLNRGVFIEHQGSRGSRLFTVAQDQAQ